MGDLRTGPDNEQPDRRSSSRPAPAPAPDSHSAASQLMDLQQAAGNRAVSGRMQDGIVTITVGASRRGRQVRHSATGITFTDDPADVRAQLENYADAHGLDSIGIFEAAHELYTPVTEPGDGVQPDADYVLRVSALVRQEVAGLRVRVRQFREDFERRANDTLLRLLDDSETRVKAQLEQYGIKSEEHLLGLWTSHSGADNPMAALMVRDVQKLKQKLPAAGAAKRGLDELRSVDTARFSTDWSQHLAAVEAATARFTAAQQDYDLVRHEAEQNHPMLKVYGLDAHAPGTAAHLDKLSAPGDRAEHIGSQLTMMLDNIGTVRKAVLGNRTAVWNLERIVGLTRELPDIRAHAALGNHRLQDAAVLEKIATDQTVGAVTGVATGVVLYGLGLIASAPTGGMSLAGAAAVSATSSVAGAVEAAQAYNTYQTYKLEEAATYTDYERANVLSTDEPSLFWLALAMVGAVKPVAGGMKDSVGLFRQISAVRQQALGARAMAMAAQTRGTAEYEQALADLEALGERAAPGAGRRLRQEVETSRGAAGHDPDELPPTERLPGAKPRPAHDPDAEPDTLRDPEAGPNTVREPETQRNPGSGPQTSRDPAGVLAAADLGLTREEAYAEYMVAIQADPDREYGLIQNIRTGAFRVVDGETARVSIPKDYGDGWVFVRHYHPNLLWVWDGMKKFAVALEEGLGKHYTRLPSGKEGDLEYAAKAAASSGRRKISEKIDWFDPVQNKMRESTFGYDADSATPYWLRIENERGNMVPKRFATLDEAQEWLREHAPGGARPPHRWLRSEDAAPSSAPVTKRLP